MGDQTRRGLDLVRAAWSRRKWLAILGFVVPASALVGSVPFLPDIYRASAVILVERQQVPEEFVRSTVTSGLETRLHTISQEILSRSRLEELIERFGLYADLRHRLPPQAVIERMRRDLQVELKGVEARVRGSGIVAFTISYLGIDPRTVADVANTVASYYLQQNTQVREQQASGTAEFLRRQLHEVKRRLEAQEQRLSTFKTRYLGETPQHMEANLAILDRLNTQLRLNNENQNRGVERRELLARRVADAESFAGGPAGTSSVGSAPVPESPVARLARLRQELAELRTRFSEKYPDVIRVKAEIAALEQHLLQANVDRKDEKDTSSGVAVPRPHVVRLQETLGEVEAEIKALKVEERRLREELAVYQRRVENTPRREQEFQELSRDYETTSDLYRTFLKRYEEAQLAETLEQRRKSEQFRILEPAIPPTTPFAPGRLWLMVVGLGLSAGVAVGVVVLAEQLDPAFHSVDELRASTTTPVIASVPRIVTGADASRQRWRVGLAAVSAIVVLALIVGASHSIAKGNEQLVWLLARGRI